MTYSMKWTRVVAMALCVAVAGCDQLLDVELPGQVTEDATFVPAQARLLVNSAIADIECALSDFTAFEAAGYEDAITRTVGWWGGRFERPVTPGGGSNCSSGETSVAWFNPLHKGRWLAEQVYERLANEWDATQVADREELMGTAALYAGLSYTTLGEFFCEVTVDSGPLMTNVEALVQAEQWLTTALGHITANGDYGIASGVTDSAEQMAYLLRARARFAQNAPGKDADAEQDAQEITQGFSSFITRESGAERVRWNRVQSAHIGLGWIALLGPVDWWSGTSSVNPIDGQPWPAVIPYTGYWDLAVLDDGRAVSDTGHPITLDDAGAVADPRVPAVPQGGGGIGAGGGPNNYPLYEPAKYLSRDDDFPLAKWEEAWLIRAQVAGGQTAIDLVNDIRTAHGLPTISGAYEAALLADADAVQWMLVEEIRRTHFLEAGRFWSAKLRYDLWFPRGEGFDQWNFSYLGGVRMTYPTGEYTQNPNLTDDDQGTGCVASQRPIV